MNLPRVLMVDDDLMVLVALTRVLGQHCNLEIVTCGSASRALDLLNASTFDLLVVDLMLPGITGSSLLELAAIRWPRMRRALMTGAMLDAPHPEHVDAVFHKGHNPASIAEQICELARFQRATP